jgi:hypothetical protein
MPASEYELFDLLKKEIADTHRQSYPSCDAPIELCKDQGISNFQEELIKPRGAEKLADFINYIELMSNKKYDLRLRQEGRKQVDALSTDPATPIAITIMKRWSLSGKWRRILVVIKNRCVN